MRAGAANATAPCRSCGLPGTVDAEGRCTKTGLPAAEGPCGTRIDRYEVISWLGGGGMGAVYRARHVGLGQPVAVKLLRREHVHDAEVVERFLREAKAAAAVASPHVVRVTDFGVFGNGQPFLVMELVPGTDLERTLQRRGRLPTDEAVGIVLDVLAGLGAAHAVGVVHRDLKPANVIVGAEAVKIVDFGLARLAAPSGVTEGGLTRTGTILGTPYAIAPEQAAGKVADARADLWAVGALLYRALSGRHPFEGSSAEDLLVRICTEAAPSLTAVAPEVPEPLAAVVARALERDPDARWPSAGEMSVALRAAMAAVDRASRAASAPTAVPPVARDRDDDEDEDEAAAASTSPALRPSLAFTDVRPRAAFKLRLALVGFAAGAGALIALALVLRPSLGPVPAALPPTAPLPAYDEVAGVVVSVAPDPGSGPGRPIPTNPKDPGVRVRLVSRVGPLAGFLIRQQVEELAPAFSDLRGPDDLRVEVVGTVRPDGLVEIEGADAVSRRIAAARLRLNAMGQPTHFTLEVNLAPTVQR